MPVVSGGETERITEAICLHLHIRGKIFLASKSRVDRQRKKQKQTHRSSFLVNAALAPAFNGDYTEQKAMVRVLAAFAPAFNGGCTEQKANGTRFGGSRTSTHSGRTKQKANGTHFGGSCTSTHGGCTRRKANGTRFGGLSALR